ncbi:isoprenyl transferase [Thermoanaerobacter sp. CM-CNRG TB177]|jgi:undecaprenyl diphosphate synthase|uniref:isoprenyl transferase n=1 Tax=unclassified Thermoanaerobacter TaxID=2636821 RepID=UPI0000E1DF81|nr:MULTISPECIES: isoprenyl transferase [unclassified Thermoanaerobacter]ABY92942.1 undecaprenyl diphosphate synthase [Thermoanaerobacter sp. X514]MBT1280038.1 isoprenyl transferase [Thermoanaerobacter sp. CM-CNRG TB177]MDI3500321.1 undecaprenyl diphosphate synthase [Thermoanaerobacter sp.]MDI3529604.1 undecaprenyl diphosphate synthase [Thermoanaerobacter sp.]
MVFFRQKNRDLSDKIDKNKLPIHIGIIMDGNGRWAQKRGMMRFYGHKAGVNAVREVVKASRELGIKYLTLYAFSTENWKRPKEEVNFLMDLLVEFLSKEIDELNKNNVLINFIGDISVLPQKCKIEIERAQNVTKNNSGLVLNIALNYGGRDEIVKAVKKICTKILNKELSIEEITEQTISENLYTKNQPDPDLIIRTSGEKRLSNFLLWQSAYSELWFTEVLWPDFGKEHLIEAILYYQTRQRRFGGV